MNKVFKVIWNKARNCYVVVSELANNRTKAPKSQVIARIAVAGILTCALSCEVVMTAFAGDVYKIEGNYETPHNPGTTSSTGGEIYNLEGKIHSIEITNGKITAISVLTGYTVGGDSDTHYLAGSQLYSLGGTSYSSGVGITISGETVSAKAGNGISVDSSGISAKAGTNVTVNSNGINVTGNGTVASGNTGLIDGGKLYTEVRPSDNGNYEEYFSTLL